MKQRGRRRRPRRPLSYEARKRIGEGIRRHYAGVGPFVDLPGGRLWPSDKQRGYLEKTFQAMERMIQLSKPDWSRFPSVKPAFVQVTGSVGAMTIMCPRNRARFIEATLEAIEFEVKHRHLPYDIEELSKKFLEAAEWCKNRGADCIIEAIPLLPYPLDSSFLKNIARRERCSDVDGIIYFAGTEKDLMDFSHVWELEDLGTKYNNSIAEIVYPLTPQVKVEAAIGYDFDLLLHPKKRVSPDLKLI